MNRFITFASVVLILTLFSSAAFSGQVVWVSKKKGAFMSDSGRDSGASKGDFICLYEGEVPFYCSKIRAVSDDKAIFRIEKEFRERVQSL